MKKKSEMGSKAGIRKENNRLFRGVISKFASLLLMIVMGFGGMSFVQENSLVNGRDTNHNVTKSKAVIAGDGAVKAARTGVAADPGDDVKTAQFITTPGNKAKYMADRATIVSFISGVRERRIWSLDRAAVAKKADQEMHFNFLLNRLYPSGKMMVEADFNITESFAGDMMQSRIFSPDALYRADIEMTSGFTATWFSVSVIKPKESAVLRADREMEAAFEAANYPVISVPSAVAAQKADREMMLD